MDKFLAGAALALMIVSGTPAFANANAAPAAAPSEILGPDAAACRAGATAPAALIHVHGFKDAVGGLRVQLYSDIPDDFLAAGKKLRRIQLPITSTEPMTVCVALPSTGKFALAVLHDRNNDNKLSIWSDGVGFSNNPKIGMGKPDLAEVLFDAGNGVAAVDVVMNYRSGLGIRPLAGR